MAVLPVLHLNGYKIAYPTVLARIAEDELAALRRGYGYRPYVVFGSDPHEVHKHLAATLDTLLDEILTAQAEARDGSPPSPIAGSQFPRSAWPMIVLSTPKGWTEPREVDGLPGEGTFRSHQVPLAATRTNGDTACC